MNDKQKFEDLIGQVHQLRSDYFTAKDYHDVAMVAILAVAIIEVIEEMHKNGKIKFESN